MQEDFRRVAGGKDVNVVAFSDTLLPDVIRFVRAQAIWIIAALVIGGVVGGVIAKTKPKQWQASATVQVGQVGYIDPPGQVSGIESIPNAVERFTSVVTQGSEADALKSSAVSPGDIALMRSTFSAQAVPNTGFIRLSVRGNSADTAKILMQAVEDQVIGIHANMIEPAVARLKAAAARVAADTSDVYKRRAELQAQVQASAGKSASAQDVLLNSLIDKVDSEWRDLETRRLQLAEQLSDERTFATRPIGQVVVVGPVSPHVSYYVAAGIIIGLAIGIAIGLLRHVISVGRRT